MSTLCFKLKHRAKMLAAGLTLSAATLAIIPGVAQATGCIDPCTGGGLGDVQNTNSAEYTVGQVAVQDGVDLNSNLNASPNTTVLSPGSYQETTNQQSIDGDVYGGGQNTNQANHTVGQAVVQDGVDLNTDANISPNVSVLSPDSYQESSNTQDVYGGGLGDVQNTNDASYTVGQVALQDGVDSGANLNTSPNASVVSPGSYQGSYNDQSLGYGGGYGSEQNTSSTEYTVGQVAAQDGVNSGLNTNVSPNTTALSPGSYQQSGNVQNVYGENSANNGGQHSSAQNTNSAEYTVGQVAVQDGVDLNSNLNASPNTTVLSPGSYQETTNQQSIGGTSVNNGGQYSAPQNTNEADHTVGQAVLQDSVNSSINANVSPNASVLSPGSYQETNNNQNITGGNNGANNGGGRNYNSADHTVGQAVVQNGVNLNTNANISPNASVLSPGSKQESGNEQGIDGSVSYGGSSNNNNAQNTNEADHTVGQAVLQDGVNSSINANVNPNVSILSPGSEQQTDNSQTTGAFNTGGSGSEKSGNEADHSIGQVVGQDLADLNTNGNINPNASVLSPGSKQQSDNTQNMGAGSASNGDANGGGEQNNNSAESAIGQIVLQDVLDNNTNVNASPNIAVLSPGSKQESSNEQAISGFNDEGRNTNSADQSVGQVALQSLADLNTNANVSPNVFVLSPGSKQQSGNGQNSGGDSTTGGDKNTNEADNTIGQVVLQDVLDTNFNTNVSPNTSVLSPGSEQQTDNCQSIGSDSCVSPDDGKSDDGKPDNGKPDDGKPDNGKPGSGTSDLGTDFFDEANVSGSPVFVNSRALQASNGAEPQFAVFTTSKAPLFGTAPEATDLRLAPSMFEMPLATSAAPNYPVAAGAGLTSGEFLLSTGASPANVGSLPNTGGSELWKAALGLLFLLIGGLSVLRKPWREVFTRS